MRTRISDTSGALINKGPFNVVSYNKVDGHWANATLTSGFNPGGTIRLTEGENEIIDSVLPARTTKPVTHKQWLLTRYGIPAFDEFTSTQRFQYDGPCAHWYSWGNYGAVTHEDVGVDYTKDVPTLLREARKKFNDENQVDNLLNVVESSQLVSGTTGFLDWVLPRKGKVGKRGYRKGDLLGASNTYLFWSFGVAPLIADIKKINAAVRTLKRDLDNYLRDYEKPYIVSASAGGTLSVGFGSTPAGYSPNAGNGDGSWWHTSIKHVESPVRRVGIKGFRNVNYHSDAFKKLDYMVKRFVATGPASFAWEKLPWSFVVDWFVDLSNVIDAIDDALTGQNTRIMDCWVTESFESYVLVHKHWHGGWTSDSDGTQTAQNWLKYYHRQYLEPNITIGLSDRFGKKQASLLGALLHQQVAKLTRK